MNTKNKQKMKIWEEKSIRFENKKEEKVKDGEVCARGKGRLKLTC
jgi:hypothetical protein